MKKRIGLWGLCALLIVLDQLTKLWARGPLKAEGLIPIIPDVLSFAYVENRGTVWGLFQGQYMVFACLTVIIIIVIAWLWARIPMTKRFLPLQLICMFLMAGAIGNVIDRFTLRFVTDFIYFELIDFPVFNVADIYVTCSAFALIFFIGFYYREEELGELRLPGFGGEGKKKQ